MSSYLDLTLSGIKAHYASGVTPKQLMSDLRDRATSVDEHNIFIHLLSEAEIQTFIDRLMSMDRESSPLWGVPFVLKDNIDLADIPTTAACKEFEYVPSKSSFVAERLIAMGAIPIGKANLDQFATGLNGTRSPWGPCRNSFNKELVSGGSSAGSAVAVAMGLATFSLGTDTAGSGRVPACFNNLVGVKPTRGLVSTTGVVPACKSLDCVSIFALHCDDANEILSIAEGYDPSDAYGRPNSVINSKHHYGRFDGSLKIGVISDSQLKFFGNEEYEAAYRSTVSALVADGVDIEEIDYAPFDEVARLLYEGPWVAERYLATLPLIEEQPESVFPVVREIISGGGKPTAVELFKAEYRLNELTKPCLKQFEKLDALLTPTAGSLFSIQQMLDKPIQHNSELGYYMNFVNLLDLAAVAVPTAFTSGGLPFGITLSAPAFSDRRLLSIANRFQALFQLPLGATDIPLPELSSSSVERSDMMDLVVCGAHLEGMPLNHQLLERGASLVRKTVTASEYKLYALNESPVRRPALVRVGSEGVAINVEVWRMPTSEFGSFIAGVASPLGLGKVKLADGEMVTGFISEACATVSATDITHLGGWRAFVAS